MVADPTRSCATTTWAAVPDIRRRLRRAYSPTCAAPVEPSQPVVQCRPDKFTPDEADACGVISGLVVYSEETFKVNFFPKDGPISLNAYPAAFPFGTNLTATGSETFYAEGLGPVTIIDSDGFQLKNLDEGEGIYYVYCIRTTWEGASAKGVAVGDPEERLWDRWSREELRKFGRISHEDEGWFGSDYDYGYVYVPEGSNKSIMYLIKDGRVTGISLVDGLFGPMY